MKKIAAIFLLFALLTVFVSCGKDDDGDNTTLSAYMGTSATTSQKAEESTTAETTLNGYILTTDPNMTVSWGITTAFQTTQLTTISSTGYVTVPSFTDNYASSAINPSVSQVTTTERPETTGAQGPTVIEAPDNTTKPLDGESGIGSDETEETTEEIAKKEKVVAVGSKSCSPGYDMIYIDFDANGWDGAIASRSTKVSVTYGSETENAPCTIKSGEIMVDVSGLNLSSGSTVKISIPEGAITTTSGSQYNTAFSVSFTM